MEVIALQRELEELNGALTKRGYRTVYADEANEPVYAYIYSGGTDNNQSTGLLSGNIIPDSNSLNGVLLINAHNRTVDEIISILERRVYSPLFYS